MADPAASITVTGDPCLPQLAAPQGTPPPDLGNTAEKRKEKAATLADPAKTVAQGYNITVPYTGSSLSMGSAAGGPGASLVTLGAVLVDAVGTMTLQAAGEFLGQTTAAMALLSSSGTNVHTQAGVSIYAGGGAAPGPCGCGGPATRGPVEKPAAMAENVVNVATAATSVAKSTFDVMNAGDNPVAAVKGCMDVGKTGVGLAASLGSKGAKGVAPQFEQLSGALGIMSAAVGAISDPVGAIGTAISGVSSIWGGSSMAAKGAAKTNIEERAAANIRMIAGKKISGSAPDAIEFKTAGIFGVNSGITTNFTTVVWGAFAAFKFEAKSYGVVTLSSGKFEHKAKALGVVDAPITNMTGTANLDVVCPNIVLAGRTKITKKVQIDKTLTVGEKTTLHNTLDVTGNTELKQTLEVGGNAQFRGKLEVKKDALLKLDFVLDRRLVTNDSIVIDGKTSLA